jgi:site-specific DNA-methyltransferase (cytosine-N4-specific)
MTDEVVYPARAPKAVVSQGDAFDLIKSIELKSIDLILTSPPYWGLRSYGLTHADDVLEKWTEAGCDPTRVPPYDWYRDAGGMLGQEPYPQWYISHLVEFFNRARRTIKPKGNVWVNLGDTYFARWGSVRDNGRQGLAGDRRRRKTPSGGYLHDKQLLMIPARFAIAMQEAGWILRNDVIWSKSKILPRPEVDRLRHSHEHWFHFVLRKPSSRPQYYYDIEAAEHGARDVINCEPEPGSNGHSATFPTQIISPRILTSCPPYGVVLDPFCGTGRALSEAVRLGRSAIGFELAETYAMAARHTERDDPDDLVPQSQTSTIG